MNRRGWGEVEVSLLRLQVSSFLEVQIYCDYGTDRIASTSSKDLKLSGRCRMLDERSLRIGVWVLETVRLIDSV